MSPKNYHILPETLARAGTASAETVSFSVQQENNSLGQPMHILYLQPASPALLAGLLAPGDQVLNLMDGVLTPWRALSDWSGAGELVHLPAGVTPAGVCFIEPLLLCPEEAVPVGVGSRLAVSIQDGAHGVVITPEVDLLRQAFGAHLSAWLSHQQRTLPALDAGVLDSLLSPMAAEEWTTLRLDTSRRYWILEVSTHAPDAPMRIQRLISEGGSGRWRSGWQW